MHRTIIHIVNVPVLTVFTHYVLAYNTIIFWNDVFGMILRKAVFK